MENNIFGFFIKCLLTFDEESANILLAIKNRIKFAISLIQSDGGT